MKVLRSILWLVLVAALAAFAAVNWQPVELHIWQGLVLDTKLPALVIGAFLLGFVPMWLVHRAVLWRLQRRITALENSFANTPSLSSTQLDAAARRASDTP
ncbi:MAG: LapA family protein [Novosphingobium sp.]